MSAPPYLDWEGLARWSRRQYEIARRAPCAHRHFYVSIDDGLYLEKCVLCDVPKS